MAIGGPFDAMPGTAVPGTRPDDAGASFQAALNMALGQIEIGAMDVRLIDGLSRESLIALSTAISLRRVADALADLVKVMTSPPVVLPPWDGVVGGDGPYRGS